MADELTIKMTDGSDLNYVTATPLTFRIDEYDCQVCGPVKAWITITLGDQKLDGTYCQVCYSKWINANIPRLTKRT